MTALVWDSVGARRYETGVSNGVLYLSDGSGVVWNGLTSVTENPTVEAAEPLYFDGRKYMDYTVPTDFSGSLRAITYPDQFLEFDGVANLNNGMYATGQQRKTFGLSYKTLIGSDTSDILGYKIHILYNLTAIPEDVEHTSIGDSTTPIEFSWSITGRPVTVTGYRPTAHIILDSRNLGSVALTLIENFLYGTSNNNPRIPTITELMALLVSAGTINITDNGDGTWTAVGPDNLITLLGDTFTITGSNATFLDPPDNTTYTISTS